MRKPFSFQMFQKYIARIKATSLQKLLVEINKITIAEGYEDVSKLRQDTSTIEANVHYPTNNSLVWDCIKKGMSSNELSKEFGCQQRSAWLLKAKYQNAMKNSDKYPLEEAVEVDEFLVGGFDENEKGRSLELKQLVVLGIEKATGCSNI